MVNDPLIGKTIGRYQLQELIGVGYTAKVYRAHQHGVSRTVAFKVYPREFLDNPEFQQKFEEEIRNIAQLEHFNILPVYDVGEDDGMPYVVMRYMTGGSLKRFIRSQERLNLETTGKILNQISAGLDYAHKNEIIHRNIHPGNILLDDEGAYLTDFLAMNVLRATLNITGLKTRGSAAYMAPELTSGERKPDKAGDVYSLGIVLFEMLTGEPPFIGENDAQVALMQLNTPVPALMAYVPDINPDIDAVVKKALAKEPARRHESASHLAYEFSQVAGLSEKPSVELDEDVDFFIGASLPSSQPGQPPMEPPPPQTEAPAPISSPPSLPPLPPSPITAPPGESSPMSPPPPPISPPIPPAPVGTLPVPDVDEEDEVDTTMILAEGPAEPSTNIVMYEPATPAPGVEKPSEPEKKRDKVESKDEKLGPAGLSRRRRRRKAKEKSKPEKRKEPAVRVVPRFRWYTVVFTFLVLIGIWFMIGAMAGSEVKKQTDYLTIVAFHADDTRAADERIAEVTQTQEVLAQETSEAILETATVLAAPPTETPTPEPTATDMPTATATPAGGSDGYIAFISERDGDQEIFILNMATGESKQVTHNTARDDDPQWSPDGKLIAFHSNADSAGRHIYIVDPFSGDEPIQLTEGIRSDQDPFWHPNGQVLIFFSEDGGRNYIRTINIAGEDETDIGQLPNIFNIYDLSPTADRITYYGRTLDGVLEVLALPFGGDSTARFPITDAVGDIQFVSYSPDRSMVVFTATAAAPARRIQVYLASTDCPIINDEACIIRRVTNDVFNYETPRFSPDGELLLVSSDRSGNFDLYLMTLEGEIVKRLTDSNFDEYNGVWQP